MSMLTPTSSSTASYAGNANFSQGPSSSNTVQPPVNLEEGRRPDAIRSPWYFAYQKNASTVQLTFDLREGGDLSSGYTLRLAAYVGEPIKTLNLSRDPSADLISLTNALASNRVIASWNLSHRELTDVARVAIVQASNHTHHVWNMTIERFPHLSHSVSSLDLAYHSVLNLNLLANALAANHSVTSIDMTGNHLTDIAPLAIALTNNRHIQSLKLEDNLITDISPLAAALAVNSTLTSVNLHTNPIDDVSSLATGLGSNLALRNLNLSQTDIVNAAPLATVLVNNSSLTALDLSYTQIVNATPLAMGLESNRSVTALNLADCRIIDIASLAMGLTKNSTLTSLNLQYNRLGDATPLATALTVNQTIKTLLLDNVFGVDYTPFANALTTNYTVISLRSFPGATRHSETERLLRRNRHILEAEDSLQMLCARALVRNVFNQMNENTKNRVYERVWELFGEPDGDFQFGEHNAFQLWSIFTHAINISRNNSLASMTVEHYRLRELPALGQATQWIENMFHN